MPPPDALDGPLVDQLVLDVRPPHQDVSVSEHRVRQAQLGIVENGGPDLRVRA
jgi:hypothetical protein